MEITPNFDLAKLLGNEKLAPVIPITCQSVSMQRQPSKSLESGVASRATCACSGRQGCVDAGREREAPLGIVYSTDAAITPKVKVVGVFPAETHPRIVYPAALITGQASAAAKKYLEFLKTPESKAIFEKYGFLRYSNGTIQSHPS